MAGRETWSLLLRDTARSTSSEPFPHSLIQRAADLSARREVIPLRALRWRPLLLALLTLPPALGLAARPGIAATRDTAFYPVASKPPGTHPAPAVRLVKVWEALIPGLAPAAVSSEAGEPRTSSRIEPARLESPGAGVNSIGSETGAGPPSVVAQPEAPGAGVDSSGSETGAGPPSGVAPPEAPGADAPSSGPHASAEPSRAPGGWPPRPRSRVSLSRDGGTLHVETPAGRFQVEEMTGKVAPAAMGPPQESAEMVDPRCAQNIRAEDPVAAAFPWLVRRPSPAGAANVVCEHACGQQPEPEMIALLASDGTIYGRKASNGHLIWRRVASHRVSMPGGSTGDYLLVVADASRELDAYRWADGSTAGLFLLESEDAYFASGPIVPPEALYRNRIYVLAAQPPRTDLRLICLRAEQIRAK